MPHIDFPQAVVGVFAPQRHGQSARGYGSWFAPRPMIGHADSTSYSGARWKRPARRRWIEKFFAFPSVAAGSQNASSASANVARSSSACSLFASTPRQSRIDGPPSLSYFRSGAMPSAWQRSSCGIRAIQVSGDGLKRALCSLPSGTPCPSAVEPPDDQCLRLTEHADLGRGSRDAEPVHQLTAQPLVLHRVRHVGAHVADQTERQLQDVRGRCRANRAIAFTAHPQQSCLLLRAGNRDAQVVLGVLPQRRLRGDRCRDPFDIEILQRLCIDAIPAVRIDTRWQDLSTAPTQSVRSPSANRRSRRSPHEIADAACVGSHCCRAAGCRSNSPRDRLDMPDAGHSTLEGDGQPTCWRKRGLPTSFDRSPRIPSAIRTSLRSERGLRTAASRTHATEGSTLAERICLSSPHSSATMMLSCRSLLSWVAGEASPSVESPFRRAHRSNLNAQAPAAVGASPSRNTVYTDPDPSVTPVDKHSCALP